MGWLRVTARRSARNGIVIGLGRLVAEIFRKELAVDQDLDVIVVASSATPEAGADAVDWVGSQRVRGRLARRDAVEDRREVRLPFVAEYLDDAVRG